MAFRLRESDCKTLECLADYRILTIPQIAAIFQKDKQVIRRRFSDLEKEGFIEVIKREFGRARGRPENLVGLTERGADIVREKYLAGKDIPYENIGPVSARIIDHQLLMNWFRIHLKHVENVLPKFSIRFLAYNSPFVSRKSDGRIITTDFSPIGRRTVRQVKFTPDAVIAASDMVQKKTVLYFLEVDCGTETLSSPQRDMSDIRQKILNYQWYFLNLKYKRYENIFKVPHLNGFRLLFITKTAGRLAALCKLTQEMQPSNFVWLTDQQSMFDDGISWKIWARGGNLQVMQRSIIGSLCCRAPLTF